MTQTTQQTPVTKALAKILADTYAIGIKAQAYHWNVTGDRFYSLHKQFEDNYEDALGAVDEIAERLRALGRLAPAGLAAFKDLTSITEPLGEATATEMVRDMLASQEAISGTLSAGIVAAEEAGDPATADLLTGRVADHDKLAWMLRSHLG
jgi:starvation-inducible DNA-binding protein